MILLVCVDDGMGMLFNGRRQSRDRLLRARILRMTQGARLWMSAYSAEQFSGEDAAQICVDEHFLNRAGKGEFCFLEGEGAASCADRAERIILYRWNRRYPADTCFEPSPEKNGWHIVSSEDFAGQSHEKITEEVYER